MPDPLEYMNKLCQWSDPPSPDARWEMVVARACEMIVARDAEIERLRGMIDQTADGKLLPDCEKLYCAECGAEVRVIIDVAYCENCKPDEHGNWPVPYFLASCYSTPEAARAAKAKEVS